MAKTATAPEKVGKSVDTAVNGAKKRRGRKHIDLPCDFGSLNIGERTATLGAKISRCMELDEAESYFCDRRLSVIITAKPKGSEIDQGNLPGIESDTVFSATADVKGFGVKSDYLKISLSFFKNDVDLVTLNRCVSRKGLIRVMDVDAIPEEDKKEEDKEGDE